MFYLLSFHLIDVEAAVADIVTQWVSTAHRHSLCLDAATLSRIRPQMISRSNCANESGTFDAMPDAALCFLKRYGSVPYDKKTARTRKTKAAN
jgi:hypothetical protein